MKLEKEGILDKIILKNDGVQSYFGLKIYTKLSRKEWKNLTKHIDQKAKLTLEVEEPILDDAERKYLSGVIRPFRDDVKCILKYDAMNKEWLIIKTKDCNMPFPQFKKGTMYKNLELNKEYTLEELGL